MANSINFAPSSYFFTDPEALSQTANQVYGPVSADQFRLTTKFSLTAPTKAIAICTSVILIQPQSGSSDKVNLILRPFKQPIVGFNIKYFVYRGLRISDFFSAGKVLSPGASTSDFINKINQAFAAFYHNTNVPDFLATYIGFDPANQPDTMALSNLFFKQSEYDGNTETDATAFDLPVIPAGTSLGNFVSGECGFDIVLNYGDYSLPAPNDEFIFDLAYARAPEAVIDLSTESDNFRKKIKKEQIFQFLDCAAYFGFHYRADGEIFLDTTGTKVSKKNEAIYTDVIQNFHSKNNWYIYIQSDRTRSYNFYGNYLIEDNSTQSLKLGVSEAGLTAVNYETNGWPLLIDNTVQDHNNARNTLYLQFVTDNNDNTVLYGQIADIDNAEGNNFCGPDDLRLPDDENGNSSSFTKVITLSNPAIGDDGAKNSVAGFNILIYQGETYEYVAGQTTDDDGNTTDIIAEPVFFDEVFDNLDASTLLSSGVSPYEIICFYKVRLINHIYNDSQLGVTALQSITVHDQITTNDPSFPILDRVIYISETIDAHITQISSKGFLSNDTQGSTSTPIATRNFSNFELPYPFLVETTRFTENVTEINGLKLKTVDGSIPNRIIIGITKDESILIQAAYIDSALSNSRIFLINLFGTDGTLLSGENTLYKKYKIGIVGENVSGTLKLTFPENEIVVYSLDSLIYFTASYSEWESGLQFAKSIIQTAL